MNKQTKKLGSLESTVLFLAPLQFIFGRRLWYTVYYSPSGTQSERQQTPERERLYSIALVFQCFSTASHNSSQNQFHDPLPVPTDWKSKPKTCLEEQTSKILNISSHWPEIIVWNLSVHFFNQRKALLFISINFSRRITHSCNLINSQV